MERIALYCTEKFQSFKMLYMLVR